LNELESALRDANNGADRVRRIVRDLRRLRPDEGDCQLIDLPNVLETATTTTVNAMKQHVRLWKEYGTTPLVEADEGQLTQVFTNLLVNAIDAIGQGPAHHQEIRICTRTDAAGRALVEIHDTGPGIPVDILPRIFDPFFTTKPIGAGMGLGLTICHSIIAAYDGEITTESIPGKGTTFRVAIPPAPRGSGTQTTAAPVGPSPPVRRGKVLVIDDEEPVAMALARLLRSEHDVTVETDASAALRRIARGESYDVIFCDLMMPNTCGVDVHDALASSAPEQAKRAVFMTGGAFSARSRSFLASVANISISKPFSLEAIRTIVSDYVGSAGMAKESTVWRGSPRRKTT
jgi:CheY-like chemotaxis protein/two-component sensor histidine kinase